RAQVLFLAVKTLRESGYEHVYSAVEKPLHLAQTAAVLEVCLATLGLIRSPISATLPQIASRLYLTWIVLYSFPEIQTHFLVSSVAISWSITEIIRYSFFGMKEAFGSTPSFLLWLRYSTFLVMYPIGISSEVGLIYLALPHMKASDKFCIRMPNKWNFSFDNFCAAVLAIGIYIPGMKLLPLTTILDMLMYIDLTEWMGCCLLQGLLIYTGTCLAKGVKRSQNQRGNRIAAAKAQ
ncbi:Very-long-chain (3R)-3-hydroxyacyl-CoA dehydratase PASTICCINO 2A, partial [Linum perenne]